jgi:hypothetical protein
MRRFRLSTKILLGSTLMLMLFSAASFGVLYRAQSLLATREMNTLLENEALALSVLVNTKADSTLDFELSKFFLVQYEKTKPRCTSKRRLSTGKCGSFSVAPPIS